MDSLSEIYNELKFEQPEIFEPRRRVEKPEPKNIYEFCMAFSQLTGMPKGYFLSKTRGLNLNWFTQLWSDLKQRPDRTTKIKYVHWYIRETFQTEGVDKQ